MEAFANIFDGMSKFAEGRANSKVLKQQARTARAQGYADEESQRRYAKAFAGEQAAALAQSGTGTGGSNALLIEQDAVNAELDALNIRYRSNLRGMALDSDARAAKRAGKAAIVRGGLRAGSALMKGDL